MARDTSSQELSQGPLVLQTFATYADPSAAQVFDPFRKRLHSVADRLLTVTSSEKVKAIRIHFCIDGQRFASGLSGVESPKYVPDGSLIYIRIFFPIQTWSPSDSKQAASIFMHCDEAMRQVVEFLRSNPLGIDAACLETDWANIRNGLPMEKSSASDPRVPAGIAPRRQVVATRLSAQQIGLVLTMLTLPGALARDQGWGDVQAISGLDFADSSGSADADVFAANRREILRAWPDHLKSVFAAAQNGSLDWMIAFAKGNADELENLKPRALEGAWFSANCLVAYAEACLGLDEDYASELRSAAYQDLPDWLSRQARPERTDFTALAESTLSMLTDLVARVE